MTTATQGQAALTPAEIARHPMLMHLDQPLPATPEQLEIFHRLLCPETPSEALVINACAGSSKTTTMVEGVNRMVAAGTEPRTVLCLAFNKSIADTLAEKMPQGTTSKTLNALGHAALRSYFGSAKIDQRKLSRILAEIMPAYFDLQPAERRILVRAIELAKMNGIWPTETQWNDGLSLAGEKIRFPQLTPRYINPLDADSFFHSFIQESDAAETLSPYSSYLPVVLTLDLIQSFTQQIFSFIDQIYLPATVASISLPRYLNVFVDEAQDLSRIEQHLLEQIVSIVPKGRLVAVGDRAQAIYAFKGADPAAFKNLAKKWKAHYLTLSISFRCAHAVVEEARHYDDRITAWDQSPRGQVSHLAPGEWNFTNLPAGTAILCRMNYPLVQAAITMIRNHLSVEFLGRDLANQLDDFLQIHSKRIKSMSGLWAKLKNEYFQKLEKSPREADRVEDQTECLRAIADFYGIEEIRDLAPAIKRFFSMEGNLKLATIHKAKGLEFPHVALLRPDLCPSPRASSPDEVQQEHNLLYVAITRAQISFSYLES